MRVVSRTHSDYPDMYGYGGEDYGWNAGFSAVNCLAELQSEDEMRIYSAILELSRTLSLAQENTMTNFNIDAFVQVIINIVNTPSYSDISNETAFHCVLCLINIMDIYPSSVNTIINHQGVTALSQKIQSLEYIDLAEKAIKALERISSESANSVLNHANIDIILNMMDFFEYDTQISILRMISNVCLNINREEDIKKLILIIPALVNFFEIKGSGDRCSEMFGLMCTSFQYICDCPLKFKDPYSNFSLISGYYKDFNSSGLMEKCFQFLQTACNSPKFFDSQMENNDEDNQNSTVNIILNNLGKLIKIFSYLCKYSSENCLSAITDMNILGIINVLLKREQATNKSGVTVLSETLSLLGALIPDSRAAKNETTDFAKNEKEKSILFDLDENEENDYIVLLVQSILPSMLKLYVSTFNQNVKFSFLQLIEEIVLMLSGESLRKYMQPYLISRFVISTMKSENYTWIEICLKILQVLIDKKVSSCNLALQREGIVEYLSVFADKAKFKELTGIQIQDEEPKPAEKKEENKVVEVPIKNITSSTAPVLESTSVVIQSEAKIPQTSEDKTLTDQLVLTPVVEKANEEVKLAQDSNPQQTEVKQEKDEKSLMMIEDKTKEGIKLLQEVFDEASLVKEAPIQEISANLEEVKQTTSSSIIAPNIQTQEQKDYFDELKAAIKESMGEMLEITDDIDDKIKQDIKSQVNAIKDTMQEINEEGIITTVKKKSQTSKNKLKKMFIKKAIQNLDDNFEGIEEFDDFEEGELDKIRDIIAKKKLLSKSKGQFLQDTRKYSRDFIGMNAAPMYKNIVSISKTLLESFEKNMDEEFSKDATILDKLTKISLLLEEESKNLKHFDKDKTLSLFQELAEFFKEDTNSTKITQYELYKSKLVHSLHCYLTLPAKQEESKSSEKSDEVESEEHVREYFTLIARYTCLVEAFHDSGSLKLLKDLMTTFENTLKTSFINYYSNELTSYHDGINLAYDLKKYSKRNKLQLTYEPQIEKRIKEAELIEKGKPFKKSIKDYFAAKNPINPPKYEDEGFEDEDFFKNISELTMQKTQTSKESDVGKISEGLSKKGSNVSEPIHKAGISKNVKPNSKIYTKRDSLYKELKNVTVSVENSSTLEVIKEFLRNRVCKKEHIQQLKSHTNYYTSLFDKARKQVDDAFANVKTGEAAPNVQDILSKVVFESFNEPGISENLTEEEKYLLIKDLERVVGVAPSYGSNYNYGYSSYGQPQTQISTIPTIPKSNEGRKEEEEEKVVAPESVAKPSTELSVQNISETLSTEPAKANPLTAGLIFDTKNAKREVAEAEFEEKIDTSKGKQSWGFLGKLKKFFLGNTSQPKDEDDEDDDNDDQAEDDDVAQVESIRKESMPEEFMDKVKDDVAAENLVKSGGNLKSTQESTKEQDDGINLKDIPENEDVVFEFFYNNIQVSSIKTIFELLNYQPTHRSIIDPHIIYFRIRDRTSEDDESKQCSEDEETKEKSDKEISEAVSLKERLLIKTIKSLTGGLLPVVSHFMINYLSPYIRSDDVKPAPQGYYYSNPYSYNQYAPKGTSKIGISSDEQRLLSKKIVRISEGIQFVMKNWNELRIQLELQNYESISDIKFNNPTLFKYLIDESVQKLMLEPLNFVLEHKKAKTLELMETLIKNQSLLSFETRVNFYKIASFAFSGDFNRTVNFLVQLLRKKYSNIPDQAISKQSKQKMKIDRKNFLECTIKMFTTTGTLKRKNFLEIEFVNEEGTGLGPTLEFYYLCSKEFRNMKYLWRETSDNSLFPAPIEISAEAYGMDKVLKCFETMGMIVARAIADDRLTDLPFSSVFWELCWNNPISFKQLRALDSTFGDSINELREYSTKKERIKNNKNLDDQIKERQLEACCLRNGAKIDDLFLFFVIPGTEVELKPKGKDIQVNESNLPEYLDTILDVMLNKSVEKQISAFRKGFNKIANINYLQVIRSDEIELIVCGNNDDEKEWTSQNLKENIIPAHGYNETSNTYLNLIEYMTKLTKNQRRQFLTFVTGSPRLPLGGFKSLKPKMNIVRKNEGENPNIYLPSVMTCQNFLKIPDYSCYEILAERFDVASKEGQENFTLS